MQVAVPKLIVCANGACLDHRSRQSRRELGRCIVNVNFLLSSPVQVWTPRCEITSWGCFAACHDFVGAAYALLGGYVRAICFHQTFGEKPIKLDKKLVCSGQGPEVLFSHGPCPWYVRCSVDRGDVGYGWID